MKYIIDTHIFLWFFGNPQKLSKKAKEILTDSESNLKLSVASIWEIGLKHSLNKLQLPTPPRDFILERTNKAQIKFLPITPSHTFRVNTLSLDHRDPFDRIIISQAIEEECTVITADKKFDDFEVQTIW